jgi:hypothetical protein
MEGSFKISWLIFWSGGGSTFPGSADSRMSTVAAVQKALMRAGIEFLDPDLKG